MHNKHKRILWLLYHSTLRQYEVPLLISFGFEIFTPKCTPEFILKWSGSETFEYDQTLSIPKDELNLLNQYDFYHAKVDPKIFEIINKYFDIVIFHFSPDTLKILANFFKGKLFLRLSGIQKDLSYGM